MIGVLFVIVADGNNRPGTICSPGVPWEAQSQSRPPDCWPHQLKGEWHWSEPYHVCPKSGLCPALSYHHHHHHLHCHRDCHGHGLGHRHRNSVTVTVTKVVFVVNVIVIINHPVLLLLLINQFNIIQSRYRYTLKRNDSDKFSLD